MKRVLLLLCTVMLSAVILGYGLASDTAAWLTLPMTNAKTAEVFTLTDFQGRTVYVEPMATWCGNCRQQLRNLRDAQAQLDDAVVFVAISVEGNLPDANLAAYAEREGFDFVFTVGSVELLQALVAEFGRSVINPPATPGFIVWPDGSFSELFTGIKSGDAILAILQN